MNRLTQWVAGSLSAVGVVCVYLLSGCLSASDMITLACCLFAIDRAVDHLARFDKAESHPSFTCNDLGVVCPIKMMSDTNTRILYFAIWLGGAIVLNSITTSLLTCAWLMVFWKNLAVTYVVHSYNNIAEFEEATHPLFSYLPADWIFQFRHQHEATNEPHTGQPTKTSNTHMHTD